MKLCVIVAHDKNRVIGHSKTNSMPWHLPPDLKHFKELTLGYPIIMGKNTYLSLPKRPLPGRKNIVITHHGDEIGLKSNEFENVNDLSEALSFSDLTRAILYCEGWLKAEKAFVIGGGQLYHDVMKKHHVDIVYRTLIDETFDGDIKFPEIKEGQWTLNPGDPLVYENLTYYFDELTS